MIIIRIVLKDFNAAKLLEELAVFPVVSVGWAGFVQSTSRRYSPSPEATRIVGYSSSTGNDVAVSGELRLTTDRDLTVPETTQLDTILTAHDAAILTSEQQREDTDAATLDQLVADYPQWDTLTTAQKLLVVKRVLRMLIRRERRAAV